jgi:hypothetical protein
MRIAVQKRSGRGNRFISHLHSDDPEATAQIAGTMTLVVVHQR